MPDANNTARCIAIIPARGGSKGIPRKNVRLVGGVPLVGRSVLAACASTRLDAVYVSTDDAEIAAVARRYGAQVIDRPAEIAHDTASSEAALLHGLNTLEAQGIRPDVLVFLQCTSPFTTPEAIDKLVAALDDPRIAAALSVAEDHGFLWGLDTGGAGYGLNHDAAKPRVRRQDLPPQYRETGAIYAMRVPDFLRSGNRFCGAVKPVPLDLPVVEIDTLDDLRVIEALLTPAAPADRTQELPPPGIKALITDFDGVHTDDCVYVDENGRESVRCSRADGMGVELLKKAGVEVLILSKEANPVVTARAKKLGVGVIQQCEDKKTALQAWLGQRGLRAEEVAYMGNDINDIECMQLVGWSCCPADAQAAVTAIARYTTCEAGGVGAIRTASTMLLATR